MSSQNHNTWNDNDNASGVPPPNPIVESSEHDGYHAQTHLRQIISWDEVCNARRPRNNLTNTSYNMDNHGLLESILMSSSWTNNNEFVNTSSNANNNNIVDRASSVRWNSGFPPGYRFCPTDGELIAYYLKRKIENRVLPHDRIKDVHLYRTTPQHLCEENESVGEKEWYFFTPRDRKYKNGRRPDRAAGSGYWKATGKDKQIFHPVITTHLIGLKKTLVFYDGRPTNSVKSDWIMHEYRIEKVSTRKRLHDRDMKLDDWVLCRIYNKKDRPRGNSIKVRSGNNNEEEANVEIAEDGEVPPQNLIGDLDDIEWILNDDDDDDEDGDEGTLDSINHLSDFDSTNLD